MGIRLIDVDETIPVTFDTAIALVRSDERYHLTVYGTQVQYRRLPVAEAIKMGQRSQHARNGQSEALIRNTLELQYAILDWQGLEDTHGQPVECPIPVPDRLLRAMPHTVINAIPGVLGNVWPDGIAWEGKPAARLLVRRIFSHELDSIRAEQTIRGLLEGTSIWRAVLAVCLKGWEHVYDGEHLAPLDEEARERLPLQAVRRAYNAILAPEIAQAAALANLDLPSPV